jgi:hypothetical protein
MQRRKQPMTLALPTRFEWTEISPSASAIGWARRKCLMLKTKQSLFSFDDNRISCEYKATKE